MTRRDPPDLPDFDDTIVDDDSEPTLDELPDLPASTDELPVLRLPDADDRADTDE